MMLRRQNAEAEKESEKKSSHKSGEEEKRVD
jgi:hypothetical protein